MVLVNGKPTCWIDCGDRGFQFGDGLFETIAIRNGTPLFLPRHIDRLLHGCQRLAIAAPRPALISDEAGTICRSVAAGVLKIQVTRGAGGRGYRGPKQADPTRVFSVHPMPPSVRERCRSGVKARVCRTRLGINPSLAAIKHTNRLEQILACAEWDDPDISEGLMLDTENFVVEGTKSNLFLVSQGHLITPAIDRCGVAGIMRSVVIEQATRHKMRVIEARVGLDEVMRADELFLTNSIIGCWPIVELAGRRFEVGTVTRRIGRWIDTLQLDTVNGR